jgi:hypothetical protein
MNDEMTVAVCSRHGGPRPRNTRTPDPYPDQGRIAAARSVAQHVPPGSAPDARGNARLQAVAR